MEVDCREQANNVGTVFKISSLIILYSLSFGLSFTHKQFQAAEKGSFGKLQSVREQLAMYLQVDHFFPKHLIMLNTKLALEQVRYN